MTFVLVSVVYAVAIGQPSFGVVGPFAVGLSLFAMVFAGSQYTVSTQALTLHLAFVGVSCCGALCCGPLPVRHGLCWVPVHREHPQAVLGSCYGPLYHGPRWFPVPWDRPSKLEHVSLLDLIIKLSV